MPPKSELEHYDVAVVGAGTTGLTLASLLVSLGVRVALVDPNRLVCQHPRASHVDDECMRILAAVGYPHTDARFLNQSGFDIYAPDGKLLMAWQIDDRETDQGHQSDYMFFQPDFEATLRGRLHLDELADLWIGWQVVAAVQRDDHVVLDITHRRWGQQQSISASYVVGCDGANSLLRDSVMTDLIDYDGTKTSLIVDIHPFQPHRTLSPTGGFILAGETPITYVPIAESVSRFQFMLLDQDDFERYEDPVTIYSLLSRWYEPGSYRILRTDVYEWNAHLVAGWRAGRILIAGDAAHLMPPMIGQGMCSGFRDAANLAWKLAMVVFRHSEDNLLDTYESERSPHVRDLIVESNRQAAVIASFAGSGAAPSQPSGDVIDRRHQPIGPGLIDERFALAGQLAPAPRSKEGVPLDTRIGYHFAVIGAAEVIELAGEEIFAMWDSLGAVVVTDLGPEFDDWLAQHDVDVAIVRPDRYVYAATRGPDELGLASKVLFDVLMSSQGASVS